LGETLHRLCPFRNVKEKWRMPVVFFATRKREIENYLCPDLIEK
jgi:hypothetical protein